MARLFWLTVMAAFAAALLAGASWAGAFLAGGTLLGSPPPEMGAQSTSFLWGGMPQLPDHPRVWRFTFTPTVIPGAPTVRIYVTPLGRVVARQAGLGAGLPTGAHASDTMEERGLAELAAADPETMYVAYGYRGYPGYGYVSPARHRVDAGVGVLLAVVKAKLGGAPYEHHA